MSGWSVCNLIQYCQEKIINKSSLYCRILKWHPHKWRHFYKAAWHLLLPENLLGPLTCWNQLLSITLPAFLLLFESVLHALQSLCMPAHMTLCTACTSKESNIDQSLWRRDVAANGNQRLLSKHCQLAFWQHCVSFPQQLPLPCQFLTSGKTTRSLICPTAFQAREARSLLKHSRHSFQCFQCFQVKLAGNNF